MNKPDVNKAQELPVTPNNPEVNLDPAGYFLIRIRDQKIEVGFCNNEHQMHYKWSGKSASDLSKAITQQNPGISTEHALYLGRELQRAQECLKNNTDFVQE